MKEQKEEAEKHIRMQDELTKLKTEHVMFKLYHIDHEAERHTEEIEEAKVRARELAATSQNATLTLESLGKSYPVGSTPRNALW